MMPKLFSRSFVLIVFLMTACRHSPGSGELINEKASLPASFHFRELGLKVIASEINKKDSTMSTLYGNEPARERVMDSSIIHKNGEIFAFVTWKQQEDKKWFGAVIPAELKMVELVKTSPDGRGETVNYQRFVGKDLVLSRDSSGQSERIKYIFGQKPSILP